MINFINIIHKWDCYGKEGIEIQIKLHMKDTDIILGSYKNYSFMNYDFLLIIGEYQEEFNIENINFDNVKIKTYYIECSKWNICFSDINKNIEYMNDINKNINEKNEVNNEVINEFYEKYGNYDDKYFTKIEYYRKKRNAKYKKGYKNGHENVWNLYIKKEKVDEFFKKFKEANIIHYLYNNSKLKLFHESCNFNDITIKTGKSDIDNFYYVFYKDYSFIIKSNILFSNCKIDYNKINFIIKSSDPDHKNFGKLIKNLYNILNKCVKQENFNKKILDNDIYNITSTIYDKTIIINYKDNKKIKKCDLINKTFIGCPIFWSPFLNFDKIDNNIINVNFNIYKIYVKI